MRDLNHTSNENCAILFSSIQSTQFLDIFERLWFLQRRSGISTRSTAQEEIWQSNTNQRSTPTTRKFPCGQRSKLRNRIESELMLCPTPALSINAAQHLPKEPFAIGDPQGCGKIFIHIYIQEF
jgi:hypothetical protein